MKMQSRLRKWLILVILFLPIQNLSAFDWDGLCVPITYCECSPYEECHWGFSLIGGVTPTFFLKNWDNQLFFNPQLPGVPFPIDIESRTFHDQFDIPWNVGVEIGYMLFDNCEIFADFSYTSAKTREDNNFIGAITGNAFQLLATHYRSYDYHFGTRYYFPPFCCSLTPFIGGKIGVTNRDEVRINENITTPAGASVTYCGIPLFCEDTTFSGGFHAGVNWELTCCLAVTFKVETIFIGNWKSPVRTAPTPNPLGLPTIITGNTGPLLEIPITLGLRYNY